MHRFSAIFAIALTAIAPASANASKPMVKLAAQTFVERVNTDVNGRQRRILVQPRELERGDRLIFVVRYRNVGSAPASRFAVTNPVPAALQIDALQPAMQVSVDNGRNWGRLSALSMPTALGGTRRATPGDVTHVRWNVPQQVQPGQEGQISYRATVR